MKLEKRASRALMKAAIGRRHTPGKYDVFAWKEGGEILSLAVAWKSFTKRSVALENMDLGDGEEIQTNATPLPNGINRNLACYIGSFRVDNGLDPGGA